MHYRFWGLLDSCLAAHAEESGGAAGRAGGHGCRYRHRGQPGLATHLRRDNLRLSIRTEPCRTIATAKAVALQVEQNDFKI